jgi:hypothetical protein
MRQHFIDSNQYPRGGRMGPGSAIRQLTGREIFISEITAAGGVLDGFTEKQIDEKEKNMRRSSLQARDKAEDDINM